MSRTRHGERPADGDQAVFGERTGLARGYFEISGRCFPRAFIRAAGPVTGCAAADAPGLRFRPIDRGDER